MRIWVIGRGYPTKQNKLLGSFEFEQAKMLADHGNEVFYPTVSLYYPHQGKKVGFVKKEEHGVKIIILTVPVGFLFSYKFNKKIKVFLQKHLYRYVERKHELPEIIHVHYPTLYPYSLFNKYQDKGVKLIGTEHWTQVLDKTLPDKYLSNLKISVEGYDAINCVGDPLAESIKELTGTHKNINVVPNIVSSSFSYSEPKEECKDVFKFVGIGRLVECKRFDLMIQAFADAFRGNVHIKLDIIGDGSERSKLERIIQQEGLEKQVSLLGIKSRDEVAVCYSKCNALVMASNLETFGVPVIEAMACGLPVVTTDSIGFLNLFNESLGYVVPADNPHALSDAMKKIYDQYESFDRKQISIYARQHFSEDAVYQQLHQIYLNALR